MTVIVLVSPTDLLPSDSQCCRRHPGLCDDVFWVTRALRRLGHKTIVKSFGPDLQANIENIQAVSPGVVFNYVEDLEGDRLKAVHVAAMLELLNIPYTGSSPSAISLSLDKGLTKELLTYHSVPVPEFFVVSPGQRCIPRKIEFPIFVKPLHGGGKDGISLSALVRTRRSLEARIVEVHRAFEQPAICERYIEGRELTIGIIGNHRLQTFPARELVFLRQAAGGPRFMTDRVLESQKYRSRWNIVMRDARLGANQSRELAHISKLAYRVLGLQGYGRIDIRFSIDGQFYVVEVNSNPALRPPRASVIRPWKGIPYEQLIARVLKLAVRRHRRDKYG